MPIQVWLARMERPLTEQEYGDMMALLPDARRERLEKLPKEKHQEVLCAYLLLRMALWEQRGWRDLPRIGVDELGKPFFPDHPDTHFSLSHTAGAAAAALADTPVGVDIERVRPVSVRAMERIAGVRTEAAFFRSWVRREARVKRTGSGIVTMMRTEAPLNRGEFYYEVDSFHGYAAGVAAGQPEPPQPVGVPYTGSPGMVFKAFFLAEKFGIQIAEALIDNFDLA